jgi:glycosyltransferase involved in cell wall biosynthesis
MGLYATWLKACGWEGGRVPAGLALERTLMVSEVEFSAPLLRSLLGGLPRLLALPGPPAEPLPGADYYTFRPGTNPLSWDGAVEESVRRLGVDTLVSHPWLLGGRTLLRLPRLGLRRLVLVGDGRSRVTSPRRLVLRRLLARGWRAFRRGGRPQPDGATTTEDECRQVLRWAAPRPLPADRGQVRVAHFVSSLNSGGAERQVCYAALLQRRRGTDVRVLSRAPLRGPEGHYRFLLEPEGVPVRAIGSRWDERFPDLWQRRGLRREPFLLVTPELRDSVIDLAAELLTDPVDVLHCYLDDCNVVGAIAACLVGVPAVVLSFRNGNPSHFPNLLRPWMLPWYRALLGRPGVALSANSEAGARDYERWLGLPSRAIPVVRNAFVPPVVPSRDEAMRWRVDLGIAPEAPVVAGVFRLQPEKRPLYFLECVAALARRVPGLRVVMVGVGCLEDQVRRRLGELGLREVVQLLGQRKDVPLVLAGSDVLLLVSDWEGTPNVVLEAQHCGCVPVLTGAGGSAEAVDAGVTAEVVGLDDRDAAVSAAAVLLADAGRRRRMAEAGRALVARRFAPELLIEGNQRLYERALGSP